MISTMVHAIGFFDLQNTRQYNARLTAPFFYTSLARAKQ
jgi:hypothetical protein